MGHDQSSWCIVTEQGCFKDGFVFAILLWNHFAKVTHDLDIIKIHFYGVHDSSLSNQQINDFDVYINTVFLAH